MQTQNKRPKKYFSRYKKPLIEFPNLIEAQVKSFKWLVENGIGEIFKEFSPIADYSGKKFQLEFTSFSLSEPKYDENYVKINKLPWKAVPAEYGSKTAINDYFRHWKKAGIFKQFNTENIISQNELIQLYIADFEDNNSCSVGGVR